LWDEKEKKIGKIIQGTIPLTRHPFRDLLPGFSHEETIRAIGDLMRDGRVRKFCAILRHEQAGFNNNAMVVWAVPPERVDEVGLLLASFPEVTHCYERQPPFDGRYNLFTMIHLGPGQGPDFFRQLAQKAAVTAYEVLESVEEFKKTSMEYF
jgi:DNA-binding Lrp family transcriptional regulator